MISIQNLTKRYGDIVAVNGISLEVARGEVLGFLGPNGAGKSTTLKAITCFIRIDGGKILLGDIDVTKDSLAARRMIGYLPEANPLYTDMRVAEFLAYVAELRSIPGPERKRRIGKVVEVCGLGEVLMKGIGELSKGYRQRVGLAQAMVHEPEILLLDEPTSGLDPNQIIEIRELIKEIGKEKTVVLSTHILPEVSATCSRVAIIHRGRIVADGTPTELQQASKDWLAIRVRVKGDVAGIEDGLGSLPRVDRVKTLSLDGGQEALYEIRPAEGADITEDIFRFAVDRGVILKELRIVGATLEDVFHQLTQ